MSNPYVPSAMTGCASPALGADENTYTGVFDTLAGAVDQHDHSSGKGVQIPTAGLADGSVTAVKLGALSIITAKIAAGAVTLAKMAINSVGTTQLVDAAVTLIKLAAPNRTDGAFVSGYVTASGPVDEDITGLTATLTPTVAGGKVRLRLANLGAVGSPAFMSGTSVELAIRDTTLGVDLNSVVFSGYMPPSAISFEHYNPTLAAHTYQVRVVTAVGVVAFGNLRLVAEEIR